MATKAQGKSIVLNWKFTDTEQSYVLNLENSALTYVADAQAANADATLTLTRAALDDISLQKTTFQARSAVGADHVRRPAREAGRAAGHARDLHAWISDGGAAPGALRRADSFGARIRNAGESPSTLFRFPTSRTKVMKATTLRILSLSAAALLSQGAGAVDFRRRHDPPAPRRRPPPSTSSAVPAPSSPPSNGPPRSTSSGASTTPAAPTGTT